MNQTNIDAAQARLDTFAGDMVTRESIVSEYGLAPDFDERLGGALSHIVVMQYVTRERLQKFLDDLAAAAEDASAG